MNLSYDSDGTSGAFMAVDTQFAFTEGHIRLLIWMCDMQAEFIERAIDDILESGDKPSDNMLNCREGCADLKVWALRLLEALEEEYEDDEDEEMSEDEEALLDDTEPDVSELAAFRDHLTSQWSENRSPMRPKRRTALQKLRAWLLSILQ
jgi:hypothetical protein